MVKKNKPFTRPQLLLSLLGIVVMGVVFVWLHKSPSKKSGIILSTPNSSQNSTSKNKLPATNTSQSSAVSSGNNKNSAGSGSTDLSAPYGTFVSSHKPGSSDEEESQCSTTPTASCYIQFTNGTIVKKLTAQQTDSNGSTSWLWNVKSAGLSQGSWQITAVASLNDQTKTAQDQLPLEVQ